MSYEDRRLWNGKSETFDGATTLVPEPSLVPFNRIQIHKVGLKVTNTGAGGITSAIFKARTSTGTDTTIGTVVVPAADNNGNFIYKELTTPIVMNPGDRLVIVVTESGTAPTAVPVVEYSLLDEDLQSSLIPASVIAST